MHKLQFNKSLACVLIVSLVCLTGCAALPDAGLPQGQAALSAAERALDEGNLETAFATLNRLVQADPQNVPALQLLARLHSITGNAEQQRVVVGMILAIHPEDPQSLEYLGLLALAAGQLSAATEYLELSISGDPNRWLALNGLGIIADEQGHYAAAQAYFLRGLALVPGHPKLTANLGWSLVLDGAPQAAEIQLRKALERAPDAVTTKSNLAFCIALQGRYDEALQLYSELYGASVAANNVGYAALVRRDRERAKVYLQDAMQLKPSFYIKASNNMQIAYDQTGK